METRPALIESLTWELRRAFRELAAEADRILEPLGISAGDRALLEFLARELAPVALSDVARRRSVSRQHIHQSLRRLPNAAWIEELPDPGDRRIVLLRLSREGRAFWKRIRAYDRAYFARLAPHFQGADLQTAVKALRQLRAAIRQERKP